MIHERLVEDGLLPPDGDDYIGPVGQVIDGVYVPNEHGLLDYERYRDRRAPLGEDESIDPFEQEVIGAETEERVYSSYAMEDTDVNFDHVLKLDASSLFSKGADLSGGIDAVVHDDGWADLKLYAYDEHEAKHMIYHVRLGAGEGTLGQYNTGTAQFEYFKLPGHKHRHHYKGTDIKQLMQRVDESYHLSKEDLEQQVRAQKADNQYSNSTNRYPRWSWSWASRGAVAGFLTGVTLVVVGVAGAAFTGGSSVTAAVVGINLCAVAIGGVAGATVGGAAAGSLGTDSPGTSGVLGSPVPAPVHQSGQLDYVDYNEVDDASRVHPAGMYPVQAVLSLKNADFYGAKIPGIDFELSANYFTVINAYSPQELNWITAGDYWSYESNFEDGVQSINSAANYPYRESRFTFDNHSHLHLTVNPGTGDATEYTSFSEKIDLRVGESILLELVVPLADGVSFNSDNPDHYPSISGFPYAWRAFFGGEVLYQCESSIQPGGWRPWLGYDSQVHGLAVRKYPNGYHKKFNPWEAHLANNGTHVVYRWATRVTRRMAVDALDPQQSPEHVWNKQKTSPVTQRNNQKEGLNMEIMKLLRDHSHASGSTPDFAVYSGPELLSGFDPDEFLYIHDPDSDAVDGIYKIYDEPWKTVPGDEADNPINDLVSAYVKNRMWHIDDIDYRTVQLYGPSYRSNNYEIQDLGTSVEFPDGIANGNRPAPGVLRFDPPAAIAKSTLSLPTIRLDAEPALSPDKGFYGCISGVFSPSEWERGVPYTVSGLLEEEIDNYAVVLTREDHFGRRTYLEFKSSEVPEHIRDHINEHREWTVLIPSFVGFGYHSIELWHKNESVWTRIGGREINVDSLRFYSVPGSLGPGDEFAGVDLKESPGDATYVYLEEYLDETSGDWAEWRYNAGRYGKFQARTYVVNKGETLTFELQDADPHLFAHRGTEWYLSEKRQAKQLQEDYLESYVRHYVDVIREDDQTLEDRNVDGRGSLVSYTFNTVGKYQLKASYRGVSKVAHRIIVVDPKERPGGIKADVSSRTLTDKELNWLRASGISMGTEQARDWKLLTLQDVHSRYRYVDGPRAHFESSQNNRFHPGNNYADSYHWQISSNWGPHAVFQDYDPAHRSHAPDGLFEILRDFDDAEGWRPSIYVRHTSETTVIRENREPLPNDIANASIQPFDSLTPTHKQRIRQLFALAPEAWQVRLPWISFLKDPHPYQIGDFYSYRTRTNIKPIYDANALFDAESGIFSGNPTAQIDSTSTRKELENVGLYLHLMDDDLKLKRFFMQDLCTGRAVIVPATTSQAKVSNENDPSSEALAVYPDLHGKVGVTVEESPGEHTYEPLDQPDYLWHYGSIAPAFTIDDNAGFGDLDAGDRLTLSGTMELKGTNHRNVWQDRLIMAVGSGNAAAATTHAYANSFGHTGDGNTQVYALAAAVAPLAGANEAGEYPAVAVIDGRQTSSRNITSHTTRRSRIVAWELSITLASTWEDYSTGDNPAPRPGQGVGNDHDNGAGQQRHEHSYTLKFDLDYDGSFETTTSGTFYTYMAESIGLSFAVEQGDARYFADGGLRADSDISTWSAAARASNVWSIYTGSSSDNHAKIYPTQQAVSGYALNIDLSAVASNHQIPDTLFGTNIENIQTKDRYWGNYETDAEIVGLMRDFPVNWVRFPGGEPTSTFHFDSTTNQLQTTARWGVDLWDTSKPANQRVVAADADFVDFTEFKQVIDHISATPFVGVNLESAYFFEALEYDELLKNPEHPVAVNKANFLTSYNKSLIQKGLDQARQVAHYLTSSTTEGGLGMDVSHWFLDNESDIATYDENRGIPGVAQHKPGTDPSLGVFSSDEGRFNMPGAHYARMAMDYMDVIDTETARSGRQNKYIASWSNTKFMRDPGWKTILEQIGDRLSFIDFHTYWNVDGGSWAENLSEAPATHKPFEAFGVSTWDIWKKQLPMQWESQDDDAVDYWGGAEQPVVWGEAVTEKLSYAEYFIKVREVLDANGHQDVGIMMAEWGVAPRGHWRLNPEAYQTTLMFTELFMQVVESGVVDYMATWPFASEPGWAVTYRANVINKPEDGTNEVQGTYYMQQQFAPFLGGKFVPIETGTPDLFGIGSYFSDIGRLHLAVLNKSSEKRAFSVAVSGMSTEFTEYKVSRLVPHDEAQLYDDTYSQSPPSVEEGSWTQIGEGDINIRPYGLVWIQFR